MALLTISAQRPLGRTWRACAKGGWMSVYASLAAYIAAATLLTIAPGLDTALVLRTVATEGPRRAVQAGLGIAAGCFGWATLVALGLGALLAASEMAYTILRW